MRAAGGLSLLYAAVRAGLIVSFGANPRRYTHLGPTHITSTYTPFTAR